VLEAEKASAGGEAQQRGAEVEDGPRVLGLSPRVFQLEDDNKETFMFK
jgi:hypothetical protein